LYANLVNRMIGLSIQNMNKTIHQHPFVISTKSLNKINIYINIKRWAKVGHTYTPCHSILFFLFNKKSGGINGRDGQDEIIIKSEKVRKKRRSIGRGKKQDH
jgi:adenosine/AMP kinase